MDEVMNMINADDNKEDKEGFITESEFLQTIIDLRQSYLDNDLERAKELLPIINNSVYRYGLETYIYNIIIGTTNINSLVNPNITLLYIIQNMSGLYHKDEIYLRLKILDIELTNIFVSDQIPQQLKILFNEFLDDKDRFFNLTVEAKLLLLFNCIQYNLKEEEIKLQNLLHSDKSFG